jgi:deoxyribose-phosphate aldolase
MLRRGGRARHGLTDLQTVCVRPSWVQYCVSALKGTDVKVAAVVGFHEGDYDLLHKAQYDSLSNT